ncbi:MAG: acyl-CoA thioesterase [Bacteroidales bacterium]|jgi:acyl-CoA thioester hydrolase|nr:acyl-CoA thioesterase [Bacteroidales bacterium]MBQ2098593.1 acyl-CoA thioesterase [Bacteroidales bacterium]MBQ5512750.1 acyl-CoA thioesterase [Bacteroidales bacterium]MBQ5575176.1 acyl-CoA thioesterase [Bacteroidales bacterium]MBR2104704.1 acyl-CoA thioesterase [Bacteroidales bacterium]
MFVSESKIRVRYGDTDKMGYCYYGNYPEFYEAARSDAFRESGCSYRVLEERGYIMPVVSMSIQYKKPAFYDDLITIKVYVKEKPGVKMKFEYEAYNEQGELLNYGDTVLCFVNKATGRPCLAPDFFMDVIGKYF